MAPDLIDLFGTGHTSHCGWFQNTHTVDHLNIMGSMWWVTLSIHIPLRKCSQPIYSKHFQNPRQIKRNTLLQNIAIVLQRNNLNGADCSKIEKYQSSQSQLLSCMLVYLQMTQLNQTHCNYRDWYLFLGIQKVLIMTPNCYQNMRCFWTYLSTSSSFCNKVSLLSFHRLPARIPKNKSIPRFLFEANFFQQSVGLFMFSV